MSALLYAFYAIHVVVAIFLILVVLLQQGKGADLSVFGGGSTQSAFGARGAATMLHKLTVAGFVFFIVTTLGIAILQGRMTDRSSVMSGLDQPAAEETVPATDETAPAAGEATAVPAAPEGSEATDPGADADGDGAGQGGQGADAGTGEEG